MNVAKLPPHISVVPSLDSVPAHSEFSVVGNLMNGSWAVKTVARYLQSSDFQQGAAGLIFQAILDCEEVGEEVNPLTVCERLERNGHLEACGGLQEVVDISMSAVPGRSPEALARIIKDDAARVRLRNLAMRLVDATEPGKASMAPSDLASMVASYAKSIAPTQPAPELVVDVDQLHSRHAAQSWAVKGVIPANSVGMFFGASGTFKSFIALDYALHRCYGMPWIGRRTKQGVPVYIAAEGGAGLMRRVEAWHKQRGLDWRNCPMRFVTTPVTIQTDATRLRDAIDAMDIAPSDVIVDTMSQTFSGEENSSTEVAAYLSHLGAVLREPYGSTVIVVHHTGHATTERPRGSSAIIANCDFLFGVYRDEKEPLATVECIKQKDGDRWPAVSFAMRSILLGQDDDGDEITSLAARHVSGADEIIAAAQSTSGPPSALLRLLQAVGTGAPEEEVRDRFYRSMPEADSDARRQAYYRAIKRAEGQGLVVRQGDWIEKKGGLGA